MWVVIKDVKVVGLKKDKMVLLERPRSLKDNKDA